MSPSSASWPILCVVFFGFSLLRFQQLSTRHVRMDFLNFLFGGNERRRGVCERLGLGKDFG
jgi:hypothetical protein